MHMTNEDPKMLYADVMAVRARLEGLRTDVQASGQRLQLCNPTFMPLLCVNLFTKTRLKLVKLNLPLF